MQMLENVSVTCPWCWASTMLELDLSVESQRYVEDCSVCCAPMVISFSVVNGAPANVSVERE
ncbi:MAG: CPXCG motif-containing cysteine-rich protein [Gammaproteobacteria bacterium]